MPIQFRTHSAIVGKFDHIRQNNQCLLLPAPKIAPRQEIIRLSPAFEELKAGSPRDSGVNEPNRSGVKGGVQRRNPSENIPHAAKLSSEYREKGASKTVEHVGNRNTHRRTKEQQNGGLWWLSARAAVVGVVAFPGEFCQPGVRGVLLSLIIHRDGSFPHPPQPRNRRTFLSIQTVGAEREITSIEGFGRLSGAGGTPFRTSPAFFMVRPLGWIALRNGFLFQVISERVGEEDLHSDADKLRASVMKNAPETIMKLAIGLHKSFKRKDDHPVSRAAPKIRFSRIGKSNDKKHGKQVNTRNAFLSAKMKKENVRYFLNRPSEPRGTRPTGGMRASATREWKGRRSSLLPSASAPCRTSLLPAYPAERSPSLPPGGGTILPRTGRTGSDHTRAHFPKPMDEINIISNIHLSCIRCLPFHDSEAIVKSREATREKLLTKRKNNDDDGGGGDGTLAGRTHIHKARDGRLAHPETEPNHYLIQQCLKCRDCPPIAALPRGYIFPCIRESACMGNLECPRKVYRRQPPLEEKATTTIKARNDARTAVKRVKRIRVRVYLTTPLLICRHHVKSTTPYHFRRLSVQTVDPFAQSAALPVGSRRSLEGGQTMCLFLYVSSGDDAEEEYLNERRRLQSVREPGQTLPTDDQNETEPTFPALSRFPGLRFSCCLLLKLIPNPRISYPEILFKVALEGGKNPGSWKVFQHSPDGGDKMRDTLLLVPPMSLWFHEKDHHDEVRGFPTGVCSGFCAWCSACPGSQDLRSKGQ
ncbi:uncharacterized protein CLUP02_00366 [Colletotrichum lupini]|uniref:Uncharacterized protein n=1 Tax=Colletotrichum lupini TaxID=145971 RepID=A0A9Q8SAX7_9PEZI|nr:uncharacterized protein CLUP02_00366 [Colletotrichum lupini]UQC73720.1 hypothetical protein CLUP02_00366 [Colletotrichum lupini]